MSTAAEPLDDAAAHPLVVRTVRLTHPGDVAALAAGLVALLPDDSPVAWVRRGDGIVGWGESLRIPAAGPHRFADAAERWREVAGRAVVRDDVGLPGTGPVAFGSFSFGDDALTEDVDPAGSGADRRERPGGLVVPAVVVGRRGDDCWLTTMTTGGALGPAPDLAALLAAAGPDEPRAPGAVTYADGALSPAQWTAAVGRAVDRLRADELDKVVLARDVAARTAEPVDVRWLLGRLASAYPSCWTFSVDGLVGATPELLLRREKGLVTSRVLAGTIRRTGDDDADLARAGVLAHSSKDLEEHEYAVASVAHALRPFCSSTNVPETPYVLHLPNVLHLASDITGVLSGPADASASSLELAAALHPTAAVCGTPTDVARDLIAATEGMDRSRYAAPVGWMGADGDGEWGIALRSAELDAADPHRLRLFAGCGIVAASDPAAELAESEAKLVPMRYALGG